MHFLDAPDDPYDLHGHTAPGWSWLWVPTPFNSSYVQAHFPRMVFKRHQESRADLRAAVERLGEAPEGDWTDGRRWSRAAVAAIQQTSAREFVLVCSSLWAFASFEVRSGPSEVAGTAFYNAWVAELSADPETPWTVMASTTPTVMAMR